MHVLCLCLFRSIRVHVRADTTFTRNTDDDQQQRVAAYFSTPVQDLNSTNPMDLDDIAANLSSQVEHWNVCGRGFTLERIKKFVIVICKYCPFQGSSGLETPQWLAKKKAVTNVKNTSDSKCFVWSLLSSIYPAPHNPDRISHYVPYQDTLNLPNACQSIPKFEQQNPSISASPSCAKVMTTASFLCT